MQEKDKQTGSAIEVFKDTKSFLSEYQDKAFKKIENILGAVFYIVSQTTISEESKTVITRMNEKAAALHEASFIPFSTTYTSRAECVRTLTVATRALQSTLALAQAARVVEAPVAHALMAELDGVTHLLAHHFTAPAYTFVPQEPEWVSAANTKPAAAAPRRQRRAAIPAGDISTDAYLVYSQLNDRAERIKTVLEAKPQATVKDISEVITDVSEKTIQRELNSLIEKGQVVREGERRWSRYSVAK